MSVKEKPKRGRPNSKGVKRPASVMEHRNQTTYKNRFLRAYKYFVELGMGQGQIEAIFGLGENTSTLLKKDPDMLRVRNEALETLEGQMASRGIVQALGYDYDEEKITYSPQKGLGGKIIQGKEIEWVPIRKEIVTKHQPGSAKMFEFMMTNMYSDKWKNRSEIVSKKEGYDSPPTSRDFLIWTLPPYFMHWYSSSIALSCQSHVINGRTPKGCMSFRG